MKTMGMIMSIFIALNLFPDSLKDNQLLKIVDVAYEQDIDISNWKVYIKKSVMKEATKDEVRKEVNKLMSADAAYTWKSEGSKTDQYYKEIGIKANSSTNVREQAIITVYNDGQNYRISLAYEITGDEWSEESWKYLHSTYKGELQRDTVYYSVYGTKKFDVSGNIKAEAQNMLDEFSAEKVEEMEENDFISVSAYVNDWEMKIPTKNNKVFNLQFGLRVDPENEQVNVAIGNPIITSGY